jgi:hypothetical protein
MEWTPMPHQRIGKAAHRERLGFQGRFLTGIGAFVLLAIAGTPLVRAQAAITDSEKAAGGKISFDVASVKPVPANAKEEYQYKFEPGGRAYGATDDA